jgi:hypothetical protein
MLVEVFHDDVVIDGLLVKIRDLSILFGLNGNTPAFMDDLTTFVFVLIVSIYQSSINNDGNRRL